MEKEIKEIEEEFRYVNNKVVLIEERIYLSPSNWEKFKNQPFYQELINFMQGDELKSEEKIWKVGISPFYKEEIHKLMDDKGLTEEDIRKIIELTYAVPPKDGKCEKCLKLNKAIEILESLSWMNSTRYLFWFDNDTEEILIAEELLMHFIQLANPQQPPRKIRLFSMENEIKRQVKEK